MAELVGLVRELVDIPSVTGQEEAVGQHLVEALGQRGLAAEVQPVEPGRSNVYVPPRGARRVIFCTHMDTVPPFIPSTEDTRFVYGRGTCDAKGIMAAMIVAAQRLRAQGHEGIGVLFVVGEEIDSIGARRANALELGTDFVIVGEPTENRLATGHKGILGFELTVTGRAAHSAYPHLGDSAIDRLLEILHRIRAADWGRSEILGEATVNIGRIEGGVAPNVLAPDAKAAIFIRVVGELEEAKRRLTTLLDGDPQVQCTLTNQSSAVTCHVVPGFDTEPVAFGTDIPALREFGKPLLIGPGSIHDAHTAEEKIDKDELHQAVDIYERIALELLRGGVS